MPTRIEGCGRHFCLHASDKPANQTTCMVEELYWQLSADPMGRSYSPFVHRLRLRESLRPWTKRE
jgi:hypothetical protein